MEKRIIVKRLALLLAINALTFDSNVILAASQMNLDGKENILTYEANGQEIREIRTFAELKESLTEVTNSALTIKIVEDIKFEESQ